MRETNHHKQARRRTLRSKAPAGHIFVADLAERGECPLSTAYGWVERGQIPAKRWRNRLIVDERAAEEFLAIRPLQAAGVTAEEG